VFGTVRFSVVGVCIAVVLIAALRAKVVVPVNSFLSD
jgi:hypothetical protein